MEKITRENLAQNVSRIRGSKLPDDLKELHEFVIESSQNGTDWAADIERDIKVVFDAYFEKVNAFFGMDREPAVKAEPNPDGYLPGDKVWATGNGPIVQVVPKQEAERRIKQQGKNRKLTVSNQDTDEPGLHEKIPEEIRFIRRFIALHGKKKTKDDLLRFINALHRSMLEKRIRKTSRYSKQIMYIQDKLVKTFNSMSKAAVVPISEKLIAEFKELVRSEKVYPSLQLIKRYVNLNGKFGVKEKAKQLIEAMNRAFEKGRISKSDKYYRIFDQIHL